jgi:hypothetical protein
MPQPYWAYPVPSWGYVGPILQQLAHPLLGLHVAILHCIKLNLTWRIFWLKMRLSSNMQIYQWNILFGWNKPTGDGNKRTMYVYVYICVFLHIDLFFLFIYLFLSFYLFTYFLKSMHVYLHIDMCCNTGNGQFFLGAKPAQNGGKQTLFFNICLKQNFHELKTCKTKRPRW